MSPFPGPATTPTCPYEVLAVVPTLAAANSLRALAAIENGRAVEKAGRKRRESLENGRGVRVNWPNG
jgi:hypothetical protein